MTQVQPSASSQAKVSSSATEPKSSQSWLRIGLIAVVAATVLGFVLWYWMPREMHGVVLQSPQRAANFALMTSTGETMELADFRDQYVMLYFGYTFCPDVCPTTLNDLQTMAEELGDRKMRKVQVILVSVDPERDTPEQLASYLSYFNPSFLGMTGSLEDIRAVASQFGIFFERSEGNTAAGYLVDHTSAITVIDPDGYVRMVFPYGVSGEDMAADMTYLLR